MARTQPAAAHVRQRRGQRGHQRMNLPTDRFEHRRRHAAIGNVQHVERTGPHLEQFQREVRRAAVARRGKSHLAWIALGESDEVLHAPYRQRRVRGQQVVHSRNARDGRKVAQRVIARAGIEADVAGKRGGYDEECGAVGCRFRGEVGRDVAGGARAVFDIELAVESFAQLGRKQPRDDVGRSARRKPDQHAHRPWRICGLRERARRVERGAGHQQYG